MFVSRLGSNAQTTLPRAIRAALGVRKGDSIAYQIDGDRVIVTRAMPTEDSFATFSEWTGKNDSEAYADL